MNIYFYKDDKPSHSSVLSKLWLWLSAVTFLLGWNAGKCIFLELASPILWSIILTLVIV